MSRNMVGRANELGALIRAWSRVFAGGAGPAHSVIITGSAGAGKSLLVASALTGLDPRPRTVLSGTAGVHTPAPYDWLAAVLNGRTDRDRSGMSRTERVYVFDPTGLVLLFAAHRPAVEVYETAARIAFPAAAIGEANVQVQVTEHAW